MQSQCDWASLSKSQRASGPVRRESSRLGCRNNQYGGHGEPDPPAHVLRGGITRSSVIDRGRPILVTFGYPVINKTSVRTDPGTLFKTQGRHWPGRARSLPTQQSHDDRSSRYVGLRSWTTEHGGWIQANIASKQSGPPGCSGSQQLKIGQARNIFLNWSSTFSPMRVECDTSLCVPGEWKRSILVHGELDVAHILQKVSARAPPSHWPFGGLPS